MTLKLSRHPREGEDPSGASDKPPLSLQPSSSRRRGSKRYPKLHTDPATIHEALWIPAFAGM